MTPGIDWQLIFQESFVRPINFKEKLIKLKMYY